MQSPSSIVIRENPSTWDVWNKSVIFVFCALLLPALGCEEPGLSIVDEGFETQNSSEPQPPESSTNSISDTHQSSHSDYEWKDYLKVIEISFRGMDRRQRDFASLTEIAIWQEEDDLIALLTTIRQETAAFSCHWHGDRLACHFRINASFYGPWTQPDSNQEEALPHLPLD